MANVSLAVIEGTTLLEVAAACEVFGVDRSNLHNPWYEFSVCASQDVALGAWFQTKEPYDLDHLAAADTVIVPACQSVHERAPSDLLDAISTAYERGARIASICSGAFVLAEAGLLDHRRATTHWLHADLLAERYPQVKVDPNVLYVEDGQIFTSAGKSAGLDLCLHLVRLDYGSSVANSLARRLVISPYRDGGQAQFIASPSLERRDSNIFGDLIPWVLARLDETLTIEDMARHANMSSRNLSRHFNATIGTSPLQWLLTRRVHRAQELLETTYETVESIAAKTGMGSAATLRRNFSRLVGVPPESYRRTFQGSRFDQVSEGFTQELFTLPER